MNIINFFRSRAAQARIIEQYDYNLTAMVQRGMHAEKIAAEMKERVEALEAENAHLRRVVGGYRSGETRRGRRR
ncbi:MAG: hypothetical protein FJ119_10825 [Deltaproteobacteria bacterium]|nr:hypothetical protein [Deltaproteobacteria bacterium]